MNNNRHDRFGKPIDIEKIKGFKGDTLLEHSTTIKELTHLSRSFLSIIRKFVMSVDQATDRMLLLFILMITLNV